MRGTYVVNYDVANAVVSRYLVRKQSRVSHSGRCQRAIGASGPIHPLADEGGCRSGRVPSEDESTLGFLPE